MWQWDVCLIDMQSWSGRRPAVNCRECPVPRCTKCRHMAKRRGGMRSSPTAPRPGLRHKAATISVKQSWNEEGSEKCRRLGRKRAQREKRRKARKVVKVVWRTISEGPLALQRREEGQQSRTAQTSMRRVRILAASDAVLHRSNTCE